MRTTGIRTSRDRTSGGPPVYCDKIWNNRLLGPMWHSTLLAALDN